MSPCLKAMRCVAVAFGAMPACRRSPPIRRIASAAPARTTNWESQSDTQDNCNKRARRIHRNRRKRRMKPHQISLLAPSTRWYSQACSVLRKNATRSEICERFVRQHFAFVRQMLAYPKICRTQNEKTRSFLIGSFGSEGAVSREFVCVHDGLSQR